MLQRNLQIFPEKDFMVFPTICAHLHRFCSLLCGNPVLLQPWNSLQKWTDNSPSSHNNSCQLMISFFYLLNFKEILLEGKALSNAPYTFPSPSVLVSHKATEMDTLICGTTPLWGLAGHSQLPDYEDGRKSAPSTVEQGTKFHSLPQSPVSSMLCYYIQIQSLCWLIMKVFLNAMNNCKPPKFASTT